MSFLSSVEGFFKKVGEEFVNIFKKAPTFEQDAQTFVGLAGPALETILAVVDPAILPVVTPVVSLVEAKLATLSTITKNTVLPPGGSSAATEVQTLLQDVQTSVGGILSLASVKNSAKVQQITAEVNGIDNAIQTLITSLENLMQAAPTTSTA